MSRSPDQIEVLAECRDASTVLISFIQLLVDISSADEINQSL